MLHRVSEMWSCVAHSVKVWEKWEETAGAWRGGCRPADKGAYEAAPHDTLTHTHNTQHDMTLITAEIDLTLLKTVCRGKELSENSGAGIKGGKPSVLKKKVYGKQPKTTVIRRKSARDITQICSHIQILKVQTPRSILHFSFCCLPPLHHMLKTLCIAGLRLLMGQHLM